MHDLEREPANIPASDEKGHNVGLSTRVPASWLRQIEQLIKSNQLPYFNKADFVRDAVFKHLKFLTDWGDKPHTSAYYGIAAVVQNQLADQTKSEFDKLMQILDKNVAMYLSAGDPKQAGICAAQTLQAIKRMPESYWRDKYAKKVEDAYGGLVKSLSFAIFS